MVIKQRYLILILLLAFLLRMNGLDFGLPYIFHGDEHQYVEAGIAFLQGPDQTLTELEKLTNPPLFKITLGVFYLAYSRLLIHSPQEFQETINTELWRTFFYYGARLVSVAAGLLTVALIYALGKRLYNRQVGLLAAFFWAILFLPVREAHFAVSDTPLTFLTVAVLYASAGILQRGRWVDYLLTGWLIGLAIATKYTGIYLGILLVLVHWLRPGLTGANWRSRLMSIRWYSSLAVILAGFAVAAPMAFTAWPNTLNSLTKLYEFGRFGYRDLLLDPYNGWVFYLKTLAWGAGFLMLGFMLLTLLLTLVYRCRKDVLLAVFPLVLYGLMGSQKMFFARFILPILPPLVLLLSVWLQRLSQRVGQQLNPRTALITGAAVLSLQPLLWSVWFGLLLSQPDTRESAATWMKANIPAGSVIYTDSQAFLDQAVTGSVAWPYIRTAEVLFDHPDRLGYYRDRGARFILTSNYYDEVSFADPAQEKGRRQWLAELAQLPLLAEFQPYWRPEPAFSFDQRFGPWQETLLRRQPGPVIKIYAVAPSPHWHSLDPLLESNQVPDKASFFGYELAPKYTLTAEKPLPLTIYWVNKGWQPDDRLMASMVDSGGFEVARTVAHLAAGFEDALRLDEKIIKSDAHLVLPPGTPPGWYQVRFSVYNQNTLQTLKTVEPAGSFEVELSPEPALPPNTHPSGDELAPGLSLVAHQLLAPDALMRNTLIFGQDNWLLLSWQTTKPITPNYKVQLALLDPQENVISSWEGEPVHGTYPTSMWRARQFIRDPWNLRLPENLVDPGETPYSLTLTLRDEANQIVEIKPLGTLLIDNRRRSSAIPTMQHTTGAAWAEALSLLGYNIRVVPDSAMSGWLEMDLFWQSLAPVKDDYLIRLNLLDQQGQIVLTHESQPQAGGAPTHSWQPGEVIHDFHSLRYENLDLTRKYQLQIALIAPATGEVLPVAPENQSSPAFLLTAWP